MSPAMFAPKCLAVEVHQSCSSGGIVLIAGPAGSGKTTLLYSVKHELTRGSQYAVCQSLCIEKKKVSLRTLMEAVCYGLAADWHTVKIRRDLKDFSKQFSEAIRSAGKPVVLFIDDAQELPSDTIRGLEQLFELAGENLLTVVLTMQSAERCWGPTLPVKVFRLSTQKDDH
jgi:type II secretory pathway predicted ATPase ExeA